MATTNTPRTIADAFINKTKTSTKLASLLIETDVIYSYGYHFPLLVRDGERFLFNAAKYSATTTRHQRGVLEALNANGYKHTGWTLDRGRHYDVYSKPLVIGL